MPLEKRKHLRRLNEVWTSDPIYFITVCAHGRKPVLNVDAVAQILISEWESSASRHQWYVGRYVIMPDHVHFFMRPAPEAKSLSAYMKVWKEWTSKRIKKEIPEIQQVWQPEFFDHLLRNSESYESKWEYVRQNPVRAKLVMEWTEWPYQGELQILE